MVKDPLSMNLTIPLDRETGGLSEQVFSWLRGAILAGTLRAGDRLPSSRELAAQLDVSRTVTVAAFDRLLAEGYAAGRRGAGTFVAAEIVRRRAPASAIPLSAYGERAAELRLPPPEPRQREMPFDFAHGQAGAGLFPLEQWRRLLLGCLRRGTPRQLGYADAAGNPELREAIASHLRRARAVACDASQVIVVSGSQQALDLVARVVLREGDVVAIEDPQYQGARQVFRASGARLYGAAVDGEGVDPRRLPLPARLAFVTPSHQFPTGAILPLARRLELLAWAGRAGALVIEDDYDGEFHYADRPVESLQGLDREGRVIYLGTFSRTMYPGLRLGYLVCPAALLEPLRTAKYLADRHSATLEQEALARFLKTGAYERHLRRVRRANAARREALLEAVRRHLGDRVRVSGEDAGTHVVLWLAEGEDEAAAIARAARYGVGVYPVAPYFLGPSRRTGLLLGYTRLEPGWIDEGIRRLRLALR